MSRLQGRNRKAFIRWYSWSLKYNDCDPAVWCANYLNSRFEHNDEERIWFAWLYGNTYNLPTAWIIKSEFPDFELATVDRMARWNTENYKRLRYQTDTKWNKGHLPKMFESYQKFIGNNLQRNIFEKYLDSTPQKSFDNLWKALNKNLYKFGRYSTWFYMQQLNSTAGISLLPSNLMLSDYSGSRSHRNGLLLALDRTDDYDKKLSNSEYKKLEREASDLLEETRNLNPNLSDINFYTMETCLCSFKKIFRDHHGRYLGYYLDRQAGEIKQVERDNWSGIDWDVLWQAREETLDARLRSRSGVNLEKCDFIADNVSHKIKNLHWMYPDEEPANDIERWVS
jgi:hypothetical protein